MQVWNVLHTARWKYRTQKIAIWAPSHNFVGLYLRNWGMYRQSEERLLSSNTSSRCPHNIVNLAHYSLAAEISPKFQRVSRLGSINPWHSSTGRQPNFAALNRGRHLCWAGRPSRWALAHSLVSFFFSSPILSRRRLDVCHTTTHGEALVLI